MFLIFYFSLPKQTKNIAKRRLKKRKETNGIWVYVLKPLITMSYFSTISFSCCKQNIKSNQ